MIVKQASLAKYAVTLRVSNLFAADLLPAPSLDNLEMEISQVQVFLISLKADLLSSLQALASGITINPLY